jgi:hypothetical protein
VFLMERESPLAGRLRRAREEFVRRRRHIA